MQFDKHTFDAKNVVLVTCFSRIETADYGPPFEITVYRKGGAKESYEFPTKEARAEAKWAIEKAREAQTHCSDPETSSSTCKNSVGRRRTRQRGPWFDGYTDDK
jgi:hypothetical protein